MDDKKKMIQTMLWKKVLIKLQEIVSLDSRSLSMIRVALGVCVLYDLYDRARDLSAHYTDYGVMHRSVILSHFWSDYWFSVHLMSGNWYYTSFLFLIHTFCGFCLMVGYRTKLMIFLNWCLTISIQTRNIIIGHSGDTLQVLLLFWCFFLPMADHFSIDSMGEKRRSQNKTQSYPYFVTSLAAFAYIFQILIMYFAAHNLKVGSAWRIDRTAAYLALGLDFFRRPFGDMLLLFPSLLKLGTIGVLWWQGIGPFLFFSPIFTGPLKMFVAFGFFFMHLNFGLAMRLGQFTFITAAGVFALIPGWAWDTLFKYTKTRERSLFRLYYLQRCKTCTNIGQFFEAFFLHPDSLCVPVVSLRNEEEHGLKSEQRNIHEHALWLACQTQNGAYYYNYSALRETFRVSPVLWPLVYLWKFSFIGNYQAVKTLNLVAREYLHEHQKEWSPVASVNKTFQSNSHNEESLELQVIRMTSNIMIVIMRNIFVFICFWIVVSRNASSLGYNHMSPPNAVMPLTHFLHLDQHWAMFTPSPPNSWWWYNIEGELGDHTKVELFANGALFTHIPNIPHSFDKPPSNRVYMGFKNHRWFKYFENGYNHHSAYETIRLEFGRWVCREFNGVHEGDKRLWKFSVHLMSEYDNAQHDGTRTFAGKQTVWNHLCYE